MRPVTKDEIQKKIASPARGGADAAVYMRFLSEVWRLALCYE